MGVKGFRTLSVVTFLHQLRGRPAISGFASFVAHQLPGFPECLAYRGLA